MQGNITPFKFSNLPKISKESAQLSRVFEKGAINIDNINSLLRRCLSDLEPFSADNLQLHLRCVDIQTKKLALTFIGSDTIVLGGIISGKDTQFAICIDERSVIDLVYLLLGNKADLPREKSVLTPVEEGIFSFIVTIIFDTVQQQITDQIGGQLALAPLDQNIVASELFAQEGHLLNMSFDLEIKGRSRRINILLPTQKAVSLLKTSTLNDGSEAKEKGLKRASSFECPLSVSIGQVALDVQQLNSLQVGDIVILEDSFVKMTDGALNGQANCRVEAQDLRVGAGQISISKEGRYRITLDE